MAGDLQEWCVWEGWGPLLTGEPHTCLVNMKGQAHASHTPITLPLHATHTRAREWTLRYSVSRAEKLVADHVAAEPVQRSNWRWSCFFYAHVFTFPRHKAQRLLWKKCILTFTSFLSSLPTLASWFCHEQLPEAMSGLWPNARPSVPRGDPAGPL